jgi:hypothetical protein
LPEYSSKNKLRDKLLAAVENAEGFGMLWMTTLNDCFI